MWNGVEHWRNVTWRSHHPLQFPLCVFISCSVPAGSGPGLDVCPDSPLWHVIISLERRKRKKWHSEASAVSKQHCSCRSYIFSFIGLISTHRKTAEHFHWTDVLHITILVKLCIMQKIQPHHCASQAWTADCYSPLWRLLVKVQTFQSIGVLNHGTIHCVRWYFV